jgi:hypothetical protein
MASEEIFKILSTNYFDMGFSSGGLITQTLLREFNSGDLITQTFWLKSTF